MPHTCHRIFNSCLASYMSRMIPFLLLFTLSCKKQQPPLQGQLLPDMLDSVNQLRSRGCRCGADSMPPVPPLTWDTSLAMAAEAHAKDMYLNGYFSHISPQGTSPITRAQQAGYTGDYVGENIAKGYPTIGAVMAAWKISEDHCKAMMDTLYIQMGAYQTNEFWVQEFGR